MNRLEVTYERVCMATQKEAYFTDMLENRIKHDNFSKIPFSKKKLRHVTNTIITETEDEECNTNNVSTDTIIHLPSQPMRQERKQTLQMRGELIGIFDRNDKMI